MDTKRFIAVGYDGSYESRAALAWAGRVAAVRREAVRAVYVVDPFDNPRGVAVRDSWWAGMEDGARAIARQAPGVDFRLVRLTGRRTATLAEVGREATMLVVGSHGHGVMGQLFVGSASQSLVRVAEAPVVVVREAQSPGAGRIVVGLDDGEPASRALEFAFTMAEATGDKVVALRALPLTAAPPFSEAGASVDRTALEREQLRLHESVSRLQELHPKVPVLGEVIDAAPAQALVDASTGASLVVVGSRGRSSLSEALLGSVSHAVLHHSQCPVAVVK